MQSLEVGQSISDSCRGFKSGRHAHRDHSLARPRKLSLASDLRPGCCGAGSSGQSLHIAVGYGELSDVALNSAEAIPQTLRPLQRLEYSCPSSSVSIAPSSQLTCPLPSHPPTVIMLATSRTALRQAATKQFTVKAGARAASAWSSVPQGPPVSQSHTGSSWPFANTVAGCECDGQTTADEKAHH